jgi:hypothetical protein
VIGPTFAIGAYRRGLEQQSFAVQGQSGSAVTEQLVRSPWIFQRINTDSMVLQNFREAMAHWQPLREFVLNDRAN